MRKTFPKEGQKRDKETIKGLRDRMKEKDKYIRFLENELQNITKPVRARKPHVKELPNDDSWRLEFVKKFKREVLGES